MAQLAPFIYNFGISLPFFFIEAKSLIELARERPEFAEPFLWIPSLNGPTEDFAMNWVMQQSPAECMPYIAIHVFIIIQMAVNARIWKKLSVPDHSDP